MKSANYSVIEIFENRDVEQFVIPEIQRDYVWEEKELDDFMDYLIEGYHGDKGDTPYLGFIYAYNDRDYPYKYFLIDGQQRITTIYLLLLASYHKRGKSIPEYLFNRQQLKLDYKVRLGTREFFRDLVNFCRDKPDQYDFNIKNQTWYHREYHHDKTIINIVENYNYIRKRLEKINYPEINLFIKFVEEKVQLSYYDIEDSRQGEDLYIYMNSRGRHLEPNETLKAKFLAISTDKKLLGCKMGRVAGLFLETQR